MNQQANIKHRISAAVVKTINRYWVDPLQRKVPFIASIKPGWRRNMLLTGVLWTTNLGRLAMTLFRVTIIHLRGSDWSAIYIGPEISLDELTQSLFPSQPLVEKKSRAFVWRVPALITESLSQCDLVLFERSPLSRWQPDSSFVFSVPSWVAQVLDIPATTDEILKGMNQNMRRNVRKMLGREFSYVFTQNIEDFDLFYYKMHVPYMNERHGSLNVGEYNALRLQFLAGGLILILSDEKPICGMLCQIQGETCQALQMGVHETQFDAVREGANVALWWYMMDWARSQGLHYFDFGRSRPMTSSGVFNFKRQWGTRALPLRDPEWQWMFSSQDLPASLRNHLNECGFMTESAGSLYQVVLRDSSELPTEPDLSLIQKQVAGCGLDGWISYSPGMSQRHEEETFT